MRSVIIFLLIPVALNVALARNLVKRSCCCDNYNECSSSCSTPCNRPRNCNNNNNNNNNWSSCNNNQVEDSVPVLIPFPPTSNTKIENPPAETTTNNTNVNDNVVDINIQNTIDNVNNISVPISLNSTNENTIIIHFEKLPAGNQADEIQPTVAPSTVDCCLVVTPGTCDGNGENCREKREWICSEVCRGSATIDDPEPPPQLTVKNENATNTSQVTTVTLCKLADGTPVACPTQASVYPIPNQVIYQPAPQPRYYIPWLPIQRNITTRPIQQVPQVPIQPIYLQQRPVYTFPPAPVVSAQPVYTQPAVQYIPQPVQQPVQTVQQVTRYVVVPQPVPQFISGMNQGQYQGNVGAAFWGAYQQPYRASTYVSPCSSQRTWQTPCGSSAIQY